MPANWKHMLRPATALLVLLMAWPGSAYSQEPGASGFGGHSVSIVAENASSSSSSPLTECMEGRTVTFTATASGFTTSLLYPMTFTFQYTRANGTTWTSSDTSWDLVEDNDAVADQVANAPAPANTNHYFDTPIRVTATDQYGGTATSSTLMIRVWRLWITQFDGGKPWKVVVGSAIRYAATASGDCTNWAWDMADGVPDAWNPTGGNAKTGTAMVIPNSDKARASNSWFGDADGTVDVFCEDGDGNNHHFYSTSMSPSTKAKVFFDKDTDVNGNAPSDDDHPPAAFVFWNQTTAGNSIAEYKHSLASNGNTPFGLDGSFRVTSVRAPQIGPADFAGTWPLGGGYTLAGGGSLGGSVGTVISGIDKFAVTIRHEMLHYNWLTAAIGAANPDGDFYRAAEEDPDGNGVFPAGQSNPALLNTHGINHAAGDAEYHTYWRECNVWDAVIGTFDSQDWSQGGKQW